MWMIMVIGCHRFLFGYFAIFQSRIHTAFMEFSIGFISGHQVVNIMTNLSNIFLDCLQLNFLGVIFDLQ